MGICGSNGMAGEFVKGAGSSRQKHANAREQKGESYDCLPGQSQVRGIEYKYVRRGASRGGGVVLCPMAKWKKSTKRWRAGVLGQKSGKETYERREECSENSKMRVRRYVVPSKGPTGKVSHMLLS